MSALLTLAFGCNLLAVLLIAAFGLTYFTRSQFMPYHAAAVGQSWGQVPPSYQVLVLALMRAVGGLCLAIVFLQVVLLAIPFRQGMTWAAWAVPIAGLLVTSASLVGMRLVAQRTPASPPWVLPIIGGTLFLVALVLGQLA